MLSDLTCSSEYLDKVFDTALRQSESTMKKSSSRNDPEDLILAQEKSNARHAADWKRIQDHKKATSSGGRLIDQLQTGNEDGRSERNTRSMRSQPTYQSPGNDGSSRNIKTNEFPPDTFYGGRSTRRTSGSSMHETRSSTRTSERDSKPRQQKTRTPTPPLGWTALNPGWAKDWHSSIIYPTEGKDRARVDEGDIEKLDDREFLNDNLIIFYLRWLQHRLEQQYPERAKRIYFQNTFFYERLTHPEKGMKGINYAAVERWTTKVNLLEYDYIIVPINEHAHWYVAIICNAPKLLPGAEVTDHSQSQGDNEIVDDQQMNDEEVTKKTSASASSPKRSSKLLKDAEVNVSMRGMSLEDQKPEDSQDPAPMPRATQQDGRSTFKGDPDGQDVVEDDGPRNVTSDLLASIKTSQTKKAKRKSTPTPRKHNPKEFRIITLDSLGTSRSATCTNLKDYLVQEIKAKLKIDIPRPGSIGTTAKNIPMQDNFYDCGLFLLSYIEMFLENPDGFISGILQNELDVELQWPKASEMRERIRNLLFDLQKDQLANKDKLGKGKGKAKVSKPESKAEAASATSSREASKSARATPDERASDETRVAQSDIGLKAELSTKQEPSKPYQPTSAELLINRLPGSSNGVDLRPSPVRGDLPKFDRPATREIHDLDANSQEPVQAPAKRFNFLLSKVTNSLSSFLGHEKGKSPAVVSKTTALGVDVIEIQGTPEKANSAKGRPRSRGSQNQGASKMWDKDDFEILEKGGSSSAPIDIQGTSETQRQIQRSPQRDVSPTLNTSASGVKRPFRQISGEESIYDLRSPSPENAKTPSRQGSSEARQSSLISPGPETSSPSVHGHPQTGYPSKRRQSPDFDEEWKGIPNHREIRNSEDEDEDDEIQLIDPDVRHEDVAIENAEFPSADDEMLLPNNLSRQQQRENTPEAAEPALLSSSPARQTPSKSVPERRERGRSTAPSPARAHDGVERMSNTSPRTGRKRKNMADSEDWQDHRRRSPLLRDSADQAIIGRFGQKHIKFEN
jgi:Ulp1 family protease